MKQAHDWLQDPNALPGSSGNKDVTHFKANNICGYLIWQILPWTWQILPAHTECYLSWLGLVMFSIKLKPCQVLIVLQYMYPFLI